MNQLRVAAVQVGPGLSGKDQHEDAVKCLVERAVAAGAEFLCFPEHWPTEETRDSVPGIIELMRELARRYEVTIIPGGFFEELPEGTYVTAPVVDPQGRILGRQKKIHLFGGERSRAKPGLDCEIFSIEHANFGVMICYDAAFPEVARVLALKGADIVFAPSRITAAGVQPWHLYLSARCLENRLPIIAPNVVQHPRYVGHSIILGLKSEPESLVVYPDLLVGGETPDVLISDIDIESARRLRISRLRERRPEAYGLITKPLGLEELARERNGSSDLE
ncbi:carbon-nitrogen hydrolase family protein [Candidatus Bathyarchaeota archaeon]|nr:carbon-nitrogen hydrolase family protein [Candidatus Bathyarchaeota archaeon]